MNKQLYKNLFANELTKIKKENRYRIFNEIKIDGCFATAKRTYKNKCMELVQEEQEIYLEPIRL